VVIRIAAEQMRPALAAEALLKASVGMAPSLNKILSLQYPQGAAVDSRLG
jgi:hypothetical protein